jgi:hypothetical protein
MGRDHSCTPRAKPTPVAAAVFRDMIAGQLRKQTAKAPALLSRGSGEGPGPGEGSGWINLTLG